MTSTAAGVDAHVQTAALLCAVQTAHEPISAVSGGRASGEQADTGTGGPLTGGLAFLVRLRQMHSNVLCQIWATTSLKGQQDRADKFARFV